MHRFSAKSSELWPNLLIARVFAPPLNRGFYFATSKYGVELFIARNIAKQKAAHAAQHTTKGARPPHEPWWDPVFSLVRVSCSCSLTGAPFCLVFRARIGGQPVSANVCNAGFFTNDAGRVTLPLQPPHEAGPASTRHREQAATRPRLFPDPEAPGRSP